MDRSRFAIAVFVTAAAVAIRLAFAPIVGSQFPYITLFAAASISTAFGGLAGGLVSVALGAAAAVALFFPAAHFDVDDVIGLVLFVVFAIMTVVAMATQLRAQTRAAERAASARRSEAETRAILESISDSFYALDREWRFTYLNQQAARYFGRPREELLGRSIWDTMPQKVGTIFERSFTHAMQSGEPVQFEAMSPVTRRWVDVRAYPAKDGISVFLRDSGERRALELGEQRMKAILSSAMDAIITIDEAERITVFSAGAEHIFGCPASEAIGRGIDQFIPERLRERHHHHLRAFGDTEVSGRAMGDERLLVAMRANGEEFPIEARISQSGVAGEKLYTVILRDVTERLRAEGEREQLLARARVAAEEAERANRAKDEFLATVSHELRTPLTPILAWTTLLRAPQVDAATLEKGIATIERAARAQARLVDDLLDVSRIIAGKLRLEVHPVELAGVVESAIESLRSAADAKSIRLQATLDRRAGVVRGDQDRLQQVTWNLLSNAVKFTPRGGRVQVVLQRVRSDVELIVRDSGAGIAPEFLPHVFERFRQHDSTTTRVHGGLGIGLAIVRHLVELHGGTVHCESAGLDQGATFTVTLPLAPVQRETPGVSRPGDGAPADDGEMRLEGRRVLVVDDERDTLDVIVTILAATGAEVRGAQTTQAALDLVQSWTPDVLVSDIGMPDEDGYALIRRLRALDAEKGGRTPAVALTAYSRVEDRMQVLLAGYQMHVAKPIDPRELVAIVATAAGIRIDG